MEASRISYIKENIYIPAAPKKEAARLPKDHPSLIIPDQLADLNKSASCGCCKGDRCIRESASWLYKPDGELKTVHSGVEGTQDTLFYGLYLKEGRQL